MIEHSFPFLFQGYGTYSARISKQNIGIEGDYLSYFPFLVQ